MYLQNNVERTFLPGSPGRPSNPLRPGWPFNPLNPGSPGCPGKPFAPVGPCGPGNVPPGIPGSPFAPGLPAFPGDPGSPFSPGCAKQQTLQISARVHEMLLASGFCSPAILFLESFLISIRFYLWVQEALFYPAGHQNLCLLVHLCIDLAKGVVLLIQAGLNTHTIIM